MKQILADFAVGLLLGTCLAAAALGWREYSAAHRRRGMTPAERAAWSRRWREIEDAQR